MLAYVRHAATCCKYNSSYANSYYSKLFPLLLSLAMSRGALAHDSSMFMSWHFCAGANYRSKKLRLQKMARRLQPNQASRIYHASQTTQKRPNEAKQPCREPIYVCTIVTINTIDKIGQQNAKATMYTYNYYKLV